jgi:fructosamine-3-kinase
VKIIDQLDDLFPENENKPRHRIFDSDMKSMYRLQRGNSSMLLLLKDLESHDEHEKEMNEIRMHREVEICNIVPQYYFSSAELKILVLV